MQRLQQIAPQWQPEGVTEPDQIKAVMDEVLERMPAKLLGTCECPRRKSMPTRAAWMSYNCLADGV